MTHRNLAVLLGGALLLGACAPTQTVGGANPFNAGLNPAARLTVAQPAPAATAMGLSLTSQVVANGTVLPNAQVGSGNGCTGGNLSPALNWTGAPAGTASFALTMYDPDAPTGSGFWHWAVFNLPASATGLPEGAGSPGGLPAGATQLFNDAGTPGYTGACPPPGDQAHRYVITLYALNTTLNLPAETRPAILGFMLNGKVLAKTSLTAYYSR